jgi:hypothetical protein
MTAIFPILSMTVLISLFTEAAWAYVGPGAGLGMIGSLIAVVGAILLAILGLVLFPLRLILKRRRKAASSPSAKNSSSHQDNHRRHHQESNPQTDSKQSTADQAPNQ